MDCFVALLLAMTGIRLNPPSVPVPPTDALSSRVDASPGAPANVPSAWPMPYLSSFASAHPSGL
jgi:hypothetical protein